MTAYLREQLRNAVRASDHKPLIVCGAGVSTQATDGKAPSWANIIKSGIKRVEDIDSNAGTWARESRQKLIAGNTAVWIDVGDGVTEKLGGAHNAEFATWLESEVGALTLTRRDLLDAILALDCPIATTNYDDILVKASGLHPIIWSDHAATHQFLFGKRQGILHLHGHWQSPAHVVLGSKSYGEHSDDKRRELLQDIAALDRPTIFIGCSQDGLTDPDFSRLDSFLAEWQDTAPRRYWLIRQGIDDKGEPKPLPSPDHSRRLFPIAFGADYDDLAPLLRSLAPPTITPPPHAVDPDATIRCIDQHEPKPDIYGREDEIETTVGALLAGKPVIVAGGPGMGKTAVATAALYDPRIVAQFGRRRVFASLESATEPRAILVKLVDSLGLPPTGDDVSLQRIIEATTMERPIAAILDNAETVFEIDSSEAERLLKLVARVKGLSLLVTLRGVPPPVPGAVVIEDLQKLAPEPARKAFLAVAGDLFNADSDLAHLLEALDGHALSICLVAGRAAGSSTLKGLRESWDEAHAEILRRPGETESRLTSVRASLALSLGARRMKSLPLARRLLALLAYLPGGLAESDVHSLLGERGVLTKAKANEAIICLHQLRLVERRPDNRLRMLTPLRECVKSDVPIMEADRTRLFRHYFAVATKARTIGFSGWDRVREEVDAEADNLDPVCELAVVTNIDNQHLEGALNGLGEFHRITGRSTIKCLELAVARVREKPPTLKGANYILWLGMNIIHSNLDTARLCFEEALSLFRRFGRELHEANCIFELGQVAFFCADYETARTRFEEALPIFRRRGDSTRYANCLGQLALIALNLSDQHTAITLFEEALPLFRRTGNAVGEANCITSRGHIAYQHSDYETARSCFEDALLLNRRVDAVTNQAYCIYGLGQIARQCSDHEKARAYYESALPLFRRGGDVRGESNCIFGLGQLALQETHEGAQARFTDALLLCRKAGYQPLEAATMVSLGQVRRRVGDMAQGLADIEAGFALYFRIADAKDRAFAGWQALHRALTCENTIETKEHYELARSAWTAIGRLDLVHDWVDQVL